MKKTGFVIFTTLCLTSLASADSIDVSRLTAPLKEAYDSLGKMGLTIEKAGRKFISGKYAVAVPKSAIIEEKGRSYVVILDPENPSMSDRHEVALGNKSDKFVHARNAVSSGDYVVVRKETVIAKPAPQNPVNVPKSTYPRGITRIEKPSTPYSNPAAPASSYPVKPVSPPIVKRTYTPPPVSERSYTNRSPRSTYQPPRATTPVSTYQPEPAPFIPYPETPTYFYDDYQPEPFYPDNSGCPICNSSVPEPYIYPDNYDYYDDQPYHGDSGCFTEPLCRAFRNWFKCH